MVLDDLEQKGQTPHDCLFIVPSQRTGIQLKRILGQRTTTPVFSPKVITLNEWVAALCEKSVPSTSDLLIELFVAYQKCLEEANQVPFSSFLSWAPSVLSDFDQLDRYCVPAKELFAQLTELERVKRWDPSGKTTPLIEQHLAFCALLFPLYQQLNNQLSAANKGYSGALFREASELKWSNKHLTAPLVLLGFNALSASESILFQHLLEEHSARVYWDIDRYFLERDYHDAGLFIREYQSTWPYYQKNPLLGIHSAFRENKHIRIAQLPHPTAQAHYAGEWLKKFNNKASAALILADEELLRPVLNCLPQELDALNITMGWPLEQQQLSQVLDLVWQLELRRTEKGWLGSDLSGLFAHPLLDAFFEHKGIQKAYRNRFLQMNLPERLSTDELCGLLSSFVLPEEIFFSGPFQYQKFITSLTHLLSQLGPFKAPADHQSAQMLESLLNETKTAVEDHSFLHSAASAYAFYTQAVREANLDFIGSPFTGVQMMGVLESRNLSFTDLLLTSLNEGILPKGDVSTSSIPYELQKHYGLPTTKEKDALFTYHFYRILQWSTNIHLTYSAPTDALMGGEPSRLIQQLLAEPHSAHTVEHHVLSSPVQITSRKPVRIAKSPALLAQLKQYAESGFSPSSLSLYLRNPLDFYKQYILRVQETIRPELGMAPRLLGNVVHQCLQWLYEPVLGQPLKEDFYVEALELVPKLVQRALETELPHQETRRGKYVLIQKVIERYLTNFLAQEKSTSKENQLLVLELEKKYITRLHCSSPVHLKGLVDRVESLDGKLRIADYKTGALASTELEFTGIGPDLRHDKAQKRFQLLCYALMYTREHGRIPDEVGIYPIKDKGAHLQSLYQKENKKKVAVELSSQDLQQFEEFLVALIEEILDPQNPFIETIDPS
jgi:hypothetical protein